MSLAWHQLIPWPTPKWFPSSTKDRLWIFWEILCSWFHCSNIIEVVGLWNLSCRWSDVDGDGPSILVTYEVWTKFTRHLRLRLCWPCFCPEVQGTEKSMPIFLCRRSYSHHRILLKALIFGKIALKLGRLYRCNMNKLWTASRERDLN